MEFDIDALPRGFTVTNIYVLPTEENLPPRAVLFDGPMVVMDSDEGLIVAGTLSTWSSDIGAWTVGGLPLPQELSEAITAHAKSLGVEW